MSKFYNDIYNETRADQNIREKKNIYELNEFSMSCTKSSRSKKIYANKVSWTRGIDSGRHSLARETCWARHTLPQTFAARILGCDTRLCLEIDVSFLLLFLPFGELFGSYCLCWCLIYIFSAANEFFLSHIDLVGLRVGQRHFNCWSTIPSQRRLESPGSLCAAQL